MHWSAQWTLFDFGEWYACQAHVDHIGRWLALRVVDNQPLQELEPHYWSLEE